MRTLFMFLRVVAALISLSFVALGILAAVLAVWLVWQLPRTGAELGALSGMAVFGVVMLYLGTRVLREQGRMFLAWWGGVRREPTLPSARLVLR
jgi:hypothetical protein